MRVKLVGLNEEMLEAVKGLEELIDFQLYNEKGSENENLEIINVSKLPEESENVIEVDIRKNTTFLEHLVYIFNFLKRERRVLEKVKKLILIQ